MALVDCSAEALRDRQRVPSEGLSDYRFRKMAMNDREEVPDD
jgi:hypothetical protein